MYAIGTEECGHTIAQSVYKSDKSGWTSAVHELLDEEYQLISEMSLWAIHLMIFVRKALVPHITNVEAGSVATGVGNVLGNKGGVGISFSLGKTSFCFLNAHFHAHQEKVHERNQDFHDINKKMQFKHKKSEDAKSTETGNGGVVDQFDRVLWMGDLNYRVQGNRPVVDALLKQDMMEVLTANDQLLLEMTAGTVFKGFKEGPLKFPPTYKFDGGTNDYDTSKKARVPSWTDRILHKAHPKLRLYEYDWVPSVMISDHKPVYAVYEVGYTDTGAVAPQGTQGGSKACVIS